jgi:hypothetical protein
MNICRDLFAHFVLFLQERSNRRKEINSGGCSKNEIQILLENMEKRHAEELKKTTEMVIILILASKWSDSFNN